jgi:hypothetical protein
MDNEALSLSDLPGLGFLLFPNIFLVVVIALSALTFSVELQMSVGASSGVPHMFLNLFYCSLQVFYSTAAGISWPEIYKIDFFKNLLTVEFELKLCVRKVLLHCAGFDIALRSF